MADAEGLSRKIVGGSGRRGRSPHFSTSARQIEPIASKLGPPPSKGPYSNVERPLEMEGSGPNNGARRSPL